LDGFGDRPLVGVAELVAGIEWIVGVRRDDVLCGHWSSDGVRHNDCDFGVESDEKKLFDITVRLAKIAGARFVAYESRHPRF
jgi:hypothetical protein